MGKLKEIIKKSNRTRWQNVSKVHQVVYDQRGTAINVCVGAVIVPQTDETENWWREKLKMNPFFEPVGLTPSPGPGALKPMSPTGFRGSGTETSPGVGIGSGANLKQSVAQEESLSRFAPDAKPTEAKGGMGLRTEIDGMIPVLNDDKSQSTIVERPKPPNMNIPSGTEELVSTGKTGKTKRGRPKSNPSITDTPVVGQGHMVGPEGGGYVDEQ